MKTLFLLVAVLCFAALPPNARGQGFVCGASEELAPNPFQTCVTTTTAYRPDPVVISRFTPMKEIRIVYHVFLKEPNDPQGIDPNNPVEVAVLEDLITGIINERLEDGIVPEWFDQQITANQQNGSCTSLPLYNYSNPSFTDLGFRVVVDDIVFVYDESLWRMGGPTTCLQTSNPVYQQTASNYYNSLLNSPDPAVVERTRNAINIFIPCGCQPDPGFWPAGVAPLSSSYLNNWNSNNGIWQLIQFYLYWDPNHDIAV